jgi:hypothetical protein
MNTQSTVTTTPTTPNTKIEISNTNFENEIDRRVSNNNTCAKQEAIESKYMTSFTEDGTNISKDK